MASDPIAQRFEFACELAREAGSVARRLFENRTAGSFDLKGDQDYLTEADGEVEKLIQKRVAETYRDDTMMGEEEGGRISASMWIVDPIDGTANFARGNPHFAISIAYLRDEQPEVGVIYSPIADELYAARRGAGATLNGKAIHVNETPDMRHATIELGWSMRRPLDDYIAMV